MYEAYWELTSRPFHSGWDPNFYFPARSHEVVLAQAAYAAESRSSILLVVGSPGVGKTTVIHALFSRLGKHILPRIHLPLAGLSGHDALLVLARRIDEEQPIWPSHALEASETLQEFLWANAAEQRHALVVLDDAHLGTDTRSWEWLIGLSDLHDRRGALATFVLVGHPELARRLLADSCWRERFTAVSILRALSRRETHQYVETRLSAAGARRPIFASPALDRIYELSGGIPARINRLCDYALLYAAAEEAEVILPEHLDTVAGDLLWGEIDRQEPPALAA